MNPISRFYIPLFVFLSLSLWCQTLMSQFSQSTPIQFKNYTPINGLSFADVNCIIEDHEGYLWIGTNDGLNRYNGTDFTVYKQSKNDSTSIPSNRIGCLYEDRNKNLWIGTTDGIARYNFELNKFERFKNINRNRPDVFPNITAIFVDNKQQVWLGTSKETYVMNARSKRYHKVLNREFKNNLLKHCSGIVADNVGNIWFAFDQEKDGGICKYNTSTGSIERFTVNHQSIKLLQNTITSISVDKNDNIWFGYANAGFGFIDTKKQTLQNFKATPSSDNALNNSNVNTISSALYPHILIGTDGGGLNIYDALKNKFIRYNHSDDDRSLLSNSIKSMYISREGTLWIGCWGSGISMYDKRNWKFAHYKHETEKNNYLINNSITSFAEDKHGRIWIGTDGGGATLFDKEMKTFTYSLNPNVVKISGSKVLSLEVDQSNTLWIGTWENGLTALDVSNKDAKLIKHYDPIDKNDLRSRSIFKIFASSTKKLWIGTFGRGLFEYDNKHDVFCKHVLITATNKILDNFIIRNLCIDKQQNLWIASQTDGAIRYNQNSGISTQFLHSNNDSTSISSNNIKVIYNDSHSRLWFGTEEGGLSLFDSKTEKFRNFTTLNGLPDNTIVGILEDKKGNLWISTNNGLSKLKIITTGNIINIQARNYTVQDGLQSNIFNSWAFHKDCDGLMYFGGINGFNVFNPDSVLDNPIPPKVFLTNFCVFNTPVTPGTKNSPLSKHISQTRRIDLSYNQSIITINFAALNFISSEKNQYAYYLEGLEQSWNYVGPKREATYTNLSPGKYTFRVKAANGDGIWNETDTQLGIVISPPWWGTWWFKISIGFIVLAILLFILEQFTSKVKNKANQTILDERNQLQMLIDNMPDLMFIKDTKSRFLLLNKPTSRHMGNHELEAYLGKTDYDFYSFEEADQYFRSEQLIMNTKTPILNQENTKIIDGQKVTLLQTKCPIINTKGETIGLVGIERDITSQKETENEVLRQSEELKQINSLLNNTNNQLLERQKQVEEQTEEIRSHAESLKKANDLLLEKQILITKQSQLLEETNHKLEISNNTKDKFLSIIAHDLKNPFNGIIGFSDILLRQLAVLPIEKMQKYIELINTSSKSGYNLLDNLLQWARSQSGNIRFVPEQVQISEVVNETIIVLSADARRKNITVTTLVDSQIILTADADMLKTVFRNILSNAIKFTYEGGMIVIKSEKKDQVYEFAVSDTGKGIEPEIINLLFKIDSKITTLGTAKETGTGLGLILCKEFIERHNGRIWVESELNRGTTFKISLPIS